MKSLADLAGKELVEYGQRLSEKAAVKKREPGLQSDGCCPVCGSPLPIWEATLEELKLERHPAADENGVVRAYMACDSPECKRLREERLTLYARSSERQITEEFQAKLARAGIQYMGMTFDAFNTNWPPKNAHKIVLDAAKDKMLAWSEHPEKVALLSGPYGTGKTHLAVAAMRHFLYRGGVSAYHFACSEGWEAIKASWKEYSGVVQYRSESGLSQGDLARRANETRLLTLDDFDKVRPSDGWLGWVFAVVNYRLERGLPMIVTVNRPIQGLLTYLMDGPQATWKDRAAALWDRIYGSLVLPLEFPRDMPSYRQRGE